MGGYRIELGEIEAALEAHPAVSRAVTAKADGRSRGIAAWIIPKAGQAPDKAQLSAFLADRLPHYMVPDSIVVVARFPLSGNGKVDVAALAKSLADDTQQASQDPEVHGEPVRPFESEVSALWSEILGVPNVGRQEKFFALGGDSLTAARILEALRSRFGINCSVRQLFAAPTVAELAAFIVSKRKGISPQGPR